MQDFFQDRWAKARSEEQWLALEAIGDGVAEMVVVLPTGSGKSLLFQLSSLLPRSSVTVVALPLVALRHDLHRRCSTSGIPIVVWQAPCSSDLDSLSLVAISSAALLLVSVEHVTDRSFETTLVQLEL